MSSASLNTSYARLLSVGTAVPHYAIDQATVEKFSRNVFKDRPELFDRLSSTYKNAGIACRYSCVPLEWYEEAEGWKGRSQLFQENAVELLCTAAERAMSSASLCAEDIDGIVAVSSTGLAVPSLDALVMNKLPFRRDVKRLPIFGLGCCGGVIGLSRVASLAREDPGSNWILLVVELCGLTFRRADLSKSNIIATALFGDGAAAAIFSTQGNGFPVIAGGEYCWPDSLDVMGWNIEDDGFGVLFSRDIPQLIRTKLRAATESFLDNVKIPIETIDEYVFHPGGAKVLDALQDSLNLPQNGLKHSRDILRNYGNMSAATVLFVLQRSLTSPNSKRRLLGALGPGFTSAFAILGQS